MSDSLSINELGGTPWAKFETVGASNGGVITAVKRRQQTAFETGEPMVWPNGDPMLETVITILTDSGQVDLHARGGSYTVESGEGVSMEAAIKEAVVKAGCKSIDAGATLEVTHTGLGKPAKKGLNNPKLYRAVYTPKETTLPVASLFSDDDDGID